MVDLCQVMGFTGVVDFLFVFCLLCNIFTIIIVHNFLLFLSVSHCLLALVLVGIHLLFVPCITSVIMLCLPNIFLCAFYYNLFFNLAIHRVQRRGKAWAVGTTGYLLCATSQSQTLSYQ